MTANGVSIIAILVVYVFADTVATANARHSHLKEPNWRRTSTRSYSRIKLIRESRAVCLCGCCLRGL